MLLHVYDCLFLSQNNPKYLDPSYRMDLDIWDCVGTEKPLSYNRRNMVKENLINTFKLPDLILICVPTPNFLRTYTFQTGKSMLGFHIFGTHNYLDSKELESILSAPPHER